MKYFLDCEFIERFDKPLIGKKRHVIDLISIGIVAEDGREYQAISNAYRYSDASTWVQMNVITPLYQHTVHGTARQFYETDNFQKHYGKSLYSIAKEIIEFVNPDLGFHTSAYNNSELRPGCGSSLEKHFDLHDAWEFDGYYMARPQFYGYYSDYDWVLFCSLFGTMMQLPKGFPMYCRDLKQTLDEKVAGLKNSDLLSHFHQDKELTFEEKLDLVKTKNPKYPDVGDNAHLAIEDARWNKRLYEFLENFG